MKTEKGVVYNSTHYAKTTTMPAMPTKPRIYKVSQSGTNIILRWTRPSTSNGPLKNYIIEMSTDGFKNIWETQVCIDSFWLLINSDAGRWKTLGVPLVKGGLTDEWPPLPPPVLASLFDIFEHYICYRFGTFFFFFEVAKVRFQDTTKLTFLDTWKKLGYFS